jgi:lipoprotein-releasing system permease protein
VFFIQKDRKVRKFIISGLYNTGLSEEFDNIYILCDLKLIQKVNNWTSDQIGGFEVQLNDFDKLGEVTPAVNSLTGYQFNTQSINEVYPQIFNWLELQNLNVLIIITLISMVAGITMISTLLIIVLERSREIGILKALGATHQLMRGIYLRVAVNILMKGMIIGNALALTIGFLQLKYGLIKLPEKDYYISQVPINFSLTPILIVNAGAFLVCLLMLLLPARIISGIQAIKVLRMD